MDQFQALRLLLALLVSIAIAALAISARPRGWLFRNLLDCFSLWCLWFKCVSI